MIDALCSNCRFWVCRTVEVLGRSLPRVCEVWLCETDGAGGCDQFEELARPGSVLGAGKILQPGMRRG